MPRTTAKARSTRFATALLALSTPQAFSFSSAHFSSPPGYSLHSNKQQQQLPFITTTLSRGGNSIMDTSTTAAMSMSTTSVTDDTAMATTTPTTSTSSDPKLASLRLKMKELNLDVYLVPSDDPHLSEYVPDAYKRRAFLSNFQGSAGTAVVTQDQALLWTDSRYFNEAALQLNPDHWKLMKMGQPKVPTITKFLADLAFEKKEKPLTVGMDPYVHSASFCKELQDEFDKVGSDLEDNGVVGEIHTQHANLVDMIWGDARPPIPTSPFRVHPLQYAGVSVADKVEDVRKEMQEKKATLAVFCTLDDVAYLFNVRAMGDVETCPVGIAYATVGLEDVTLYCDSRKVESADVQQHLSEVTLKPYDDIVDDIKQHVADSSKHKVWLDTSRANYALCHAVPEKQLVDAQNAITPMKACKNEAELEGMRQAHIVDGAAMAHFMSWLQAEMDSGNRVSEVDIDLKLTGYRAQQPGFLEVSFPTIAGVGSNGAIVHYRASEDSELMQHLDKSNPILIDSGGQYEYGTTDVTRTWHFGTPTSEFINYYTRVLKGNIGVDTMVFPEHTPGFVLDVFARKSLWDIEKDYGHGTGHGVGAALNVHEGPHSISPRWANKQVLKRGMIVSNEPGYYDDGRFGIRIENLLEIAHLHPQDDENDDAPKEKKFLKFEKLTMIPIQKNLINLDLMTEEELDWLDSYHELVFEKVSPLLEKDSPAMAWLEKSCAKIERNE